MTPEQEDALIQEAIYAMDCPVSGDRREAIRLAIRAAYAQGNTDGVAAERERCAKVCEDLWEYDTSRYDGNEVTAKDCAAAIRREP